MKTLSEKQNQSIISSLNDLQKNILTELVTKIEYSKTYQGKNKKVQQFFVAPEQLLPEYVQEDCDKKTLIHFYLSVSELEKAGLVSVQYYDNEKIYRIYAWLWNYRLYCDILQREPKIEIADKSLILFQEYSRRSSLLNKVCLEQYDRLLHNKNLSVARNVNDLENVLRLIFLIESNSSEMMERELSVKVLADSKKFEKEYRTRVGKLFIKHGDYSFFTPDMTQKEMIDAVYSHHLIMKNPTYIHFKGNGTIIFKDGFEMPLSYSHPTSIVSTDLGNIQTIHIENSHVMTIENLTSFNHMKREDICFLYLNGYANFAKKSFLLKIHEDNPDLKWQHFGDIDPDGFMIAYCLQRDTQIPFELYKMSEEYLERYVLFARHLTDEDRKKAERMIRENIYPNHLLHMLSLGLKLEQEIIEVSP